ncbi:MAG TPA: DUF3619 family protein [Geobacteraceae bacterium]
MNGQELDEKFVKRLKVELDAGSERLDPSVSTRLRDGRQVAVARAGKRSWGLFSLPRWVTASGLATAAVLVVAVSLWNGSNGQRTLPGKIGDDFEIITAQEQLDLYDDLEFYRWLAESSRDR